MEHVEVRGAFKDYGRSRALFGVSLRLLAGTATALLGDNGAGKSTLVHLLSSLTLPTKGKVLYDGQPAGALDPGALRAELGVLSHEVRCYGDLTARENLAFFGRLYPRVLQGLPARVSALLERVGLSGASDRPVRTFSRGMLQRLAVARTLLPQPALLLLDEPYTGLDQGGMTLLTELLLDERARGAILLVVSHDLPAIAPLCDRAVVLRRGRIVAEESYQAGACAPADLSALYERAHRPDGARGEAGR